MTPWTDAPGSSGLNLGIRLAGVAGREWDGVGDDGAKMAEFQDKISRVLVPRPYFRRYFRPRPYFRPLCPYFSVPISLFLVHPVLISVPLGLPGKPRA